MVLKQVCQLLDDQVMKGKSANAKCPFDNMRQHATHKTLTLVVEIVGIVLSISFLVFIFAYHRGHPFSCDHHSFHWQLVPYILAAVLSIIGLVVAISGLVKGC